MMVSIQLFNTINSLSVAATPAMGNSRGFWVLAGHLLVGARRGCVLQHRRCAAVLVHAYWVSVIHPLYCWVMIRTRQVLQQRSKSGGRSEQPCDARSVQHASHTCAATDVCQPSFVEAVLTVVLPGVMISTNRLLFVLFVNTTSVGGDTGVSGHVVWFCQRDL